MSPFTRGLFVKNTSYDLDTDLAPPILQRSKTAPPLQAAQAGNDSDCDSEETHASLSSRSELDNASDMEEHSVEGHSIEMAPRIAASTALEPLPITRTSTFDAFEHWEPASPMEPTLQTEQSPCSLCREDTFDDFEYHPGQFVQNMTPAIPFQLSQDQLEVSIVEEDAAAGTQQWQSLDNSPPFQPQTLNRMQNCINGATVATRVYWTVDGRKLRSNDRLTVSPLFKLTNGCGAPLPFKMTINPIVMSEAKGGASFRKAGGRATVTLKCEAPCDEHTCYPISFKLSAGSGHEGQQGFEAARGPFTSNFARSGVCGLPKECEVWDFLPLVDQESQTFVVCLEVFGASHAQ